MRQLAVLFALLLAVAAPASAQVSGSTSGTPVIGAGAGGGPAVETVPVQGLTRQSVVSTSVANTANTITLTGVAGRAVCLRQILIYASAAGTATLTVQDGATVVADFGALTLGVAAIAPGGSLLICGSLGNNLVVNIGAAGAAVTTTTSAIADRQ